MKLRSPAVLLLGLASTFLLVGSRLPTARAAWAAATLALAVALIGLAVVAAWSRERRGLSIAISLVGICLVATPPSAGAFLNFVPDALAALVLLALLHVSWAGEMPHAPPLGSATHAPRGATVMRWLTLLPGFLALLLVPPLILWILPDRLGSSLELRGPAGPLAFGLVIVVVVLAVRWVRDAYTDASAPAPQPRRAPVESRASQEVGEP